VPDLLAHSGAVVCLMVLGLLIVESGLFVGVFLPGDSLLFGAGLLVGSGRIDLPVAVLAASAWSGAVLGDSLGYGLGRWCGHTWLTRGWTRGGPRFLAAAERMYARHGWFALVVCRWYPGVRAIVPTLAGAGRMRPASFAAANAVGAVLWAVGMVLLGYATASVPGVRDVALWAMAASIVATAAYVLAHVVRGRARRRSGV
jgi:membrane-associated protein